MLAPARSEHFAGGWQARAVRLVGHGAPEFWAPGAF
jgi:hypothetical protein